MRELLSSFEPAPQELIAKGALTVKEAERELLVQALKECHGNRTLAAQKLGISRRTLHRRLHQFHLEEI